VVLGVTLPSLKGNKVVIVTFKPSHTVSWDYSQERP
jgi:hypothetical protein